MIIPAKRSCKSPIATWLPSIKCGSGQPHIICPIDIYIRTAKNPIDAIRRCFKTGVSRSLRRPLPPTRSAPALQCPVLSGMRHIRHLPPHESRSPGHIALDAHRICQQADRACRDTRHFRYCLFNPAAACRAAHAGYCILLHGLLLSLNCPYNIPPQVYVNPNFIYDLFFSTK